ncbi:hypothetical protein JRO89_XS05G0161400 [Xanthoceras sorbifolium]|uniref:Retrotransposon gag domain-containing protein n=1 Tax=Xanthoceras sorbifolium TaxID=99658 RepID=A0ABQ8I2M0_9ROSI|nr:hypothetical protein JRO89_XS05G0161400 [Xanthoceras sorbifolium]
MAEVLAAALQRPREQNVSIENAYKLGAKSYDGTGDPDRTLSWLETNEEIFQVMGCIKELMVTYSAFLLKDRAKDCYKDTQIEEFFKLEQGSLSVVEYEKKFSDLIRAVPFTADNEEQKANKFAVGLNSRIRAYVSSATHTQFGPLVETATRVERRAQFSQASVKPPTGFRGTRDSGKSFPRLPYCGVQQSIKKQISSFRVYQRGRGQQRGGVQSRRPNVSGQPSGGAGRGGPPRGQPGRPHAQARVFLATQQEADATPKVVTSTITVFDRDAYVLIDLGATHSFVSVRFIRDTRVES